MLEEHHLRAAEHQRADDTDRPTAQRELHDLATQGRLHPGLLAQQPVHPAGWHQAAGDVTRQRAGDSEQPRTHGEGGHLEQRRHGRQLRDLAEPLLTTQIEQVEIAQFPGHEPHGRDPDHQTGRRAFERAPARQEQVADEHDPDHRHRRDRHARGRPDQALGLLPTTLGAQIRDETLLHDVDPERGDRRRDRHTPHDVGEDTEPLRTQQPRHDRIADEAGQRHRRTGCEAQQRVLGEARRHQRCPRVSRCVASLARDFAALAHASEPGRPYRTPAAIDLVTPRTEPAPSADPTAEVSM